MIYLKILVTGAKGQLGIDVVNALSNKNIIIGHDVDTLDIANLESTLELTKAEKPDLIINCAAYTNVDGCEENIDTAYKVNAIGARNLAIASVETNSRLLHISTDFVFDGKAEKPYIEFDSPSPLSVYGKSKLAGEEFIRQINPRHYILRTAWLYGKNGNNFVKTMIKLANEKNVINVVDDQFGSPTLTNDLVKAMELIIGTEAYGTYHSTNNGECSWNEFAKKIFAYAGKEGIEVKPISTKELNRPAIRPAYSVLKNYMLELQFSYNMRDWEEGLKDYFK
jgi:dTDP-4-dehydrorhamnose reductase